MHELFFFFCFVLLWNCNVLRFHVMRKKVTAFKEDLKKVSHHTCLRENEDWRLWGAAVFNWYWGLPCSHANQTKSRVKIFDEKLSKNVSIWAHSRPQICSYIMSTVTRYPRKTRTLTFTSWIHSLLCPSNQSIAQGKRNTDGFELLVRNMKDYKNEVQPLGFITKSTTDDDRLEKIMPMF